MIHLTYIIFETFESHMFDICGPLIWFPFRVNNDVEVYNVKKIRKDIMKPPDLSHYLVVPCVDLLSNACNEASCSLNSNTSLKVAVVSGGETKTWICSSGGESGKYFEIFFVARSSSPSLSVRLLKRSS